MKKQYTIHKIFLIIVLGFSSLLNAQVNTQSVIAEAKKANSNNPADSIQCKVPMEAAEIEIAKASIEAKPMSQAKLNILKQVLKSHCLNVSQVKEFAMLFSLEDDKLEVTKMCYIKTIDFKNYNKLNDIFTFETSIQDLNAYISTIKR
jgi:hypothetical protein